MKKETVIRSTSTRRDIASTMAEQTGVPYGQVYKMLQMFLDNLLENLIENQHLELRGFGVFEIITRKGRVGRNPRKPTEEVWIPDRQVIRFRPSAHLKKQIAPQETIPIKKGAK